MGGVEVELMHLESRHCKEVSNQPQASVALQSRGKSLLYTLNMRLGGPLMWSEDFGEEKRFLLMLGNEKLCLDTVTKPPLPQKPINV